MRQIGLRAGEKVIPEALIHALEDVARIKGVEVHEVMIEFLEERLRSWLAYRDRSTPPSQRRLDQVQPPPAPLFPLKRGRQQFQEVRPRPPKAAPPSPAPPSSSGPAPTPSAPPPDGDGDV